MQLINMLYGRVILNVVSESVELFSFMLPL